LLELFEQHLDLSDIGHNDLDRESKVLSRCLAAYAVYRQTGCSEEEAAKSVWDGSDDNGVDAVFHDSSESRIIIVQSKWIQAGAGEPSVADIAVFSNGVQDVVEQNIANFHPRLHAKLNEIAQAIMVPGVTLEIILVSTGASELAKHGTANIDRVLATLNDIEGGDPIAKSTVLGLKEVYTSLATTSASAGISITANITDWSFVSQPYSAYFGIIDGLQLKEWWDVFGKRIVAKNIRHALGATDINEGIRSTAKNTPEDFWYFNNGITLIADEIIRAPKAAASRSSGTFEFKGASIVNGAQTVSTLARVDTDESLGKVRVPIRVINLSGAPPTFGGEVTRTNNLQNRVEGRDFVAQDPEQTRLQQEMSIEGIEYQFLRGDDFATSATSCDLIEVTTALACASGDAALAVQVKTGIGRFYNDLKRAPYKTIFNPTLSGAKAFNTTLVQRRIDAWIEGTKQGLVKRSGYSWGLLIHGNRIISAGVFKILGRDAIEKSIDDFRRNLDSLEIEKICNLVYIGVLAALDRDYPGKFLAVLFKSPAMSKDVFEKGVTSARAAATQPPT
jgi:hypothetical protein